MKTLKIAIILTAVFALATVTIGLTLAHNFGSEGFFGGMMGYTTYTGDEDWWTEMREHMEGRWNGIEDEEWFDDMTAYMEEHWSEVENQPWFDSMVEYMEENGHYGFGHNGYSQRGFGCWGW